MSLKGLECRRVSKLVDSDACPRPTTDLHEQFRDDEKIFFAVIPTIGAPVFCGVLCVRLALRSFVFCVKQEILSATVLSFFGSAPLHHVSSLFVLYTC